MPFTHLLANRRLLICCLLAGWLSAQSLHAADEESAELKGIVRDTTEALIPTAEIELHAAVGDRSWTTRTDELGTFHLKSIPPGAYLLSVRSAGFTERLVDDLSLTSGKNAVEVVLEVAGKTEVAEVVAAKSSAEPETKLRPIEKPIPNPRFLRGEVPERELPMRGRIYTDWFGLRNEGGFVNQLSNRVRFEIGEPGGGWNWRIDFRDRFTAGPNTRHQTSIYDARLAFDDIEKPLFLSMGQMNLYDTAGIGELLGGVVGYRPEPRLLVGAYGGLRPNLYRTELDTDFRKYGFFLRYLGPKAQSLSLSLNELRFGGATERRYLYLSGLTPVGDRVVLYGNLEYEVGPRVRSTDRLSRVFLNARFDVTPRIDVLANFSSGKGLDFHRFLLERTEDPLGGRSELERFYYNTQYGMRLRYRLTEKWRVFVGQRTSERMDRGIRNRTTQLGASSSNLFDQGVSLYANYNLNRGSESESDSLYLSFSKSLGRHSWSTSYSTSFNGLRLSAAGGIPEIVHLASRQTLFNELFLVLNRSWAVSLQYEHTFGQGHEEDLVFIRFLWRM